MKNRINILMIVVAVFYTSACSDVEYRDPIGGSDDPPAQVTIRDVRSFNGGVTIFYDLPKDDNLKGVSATYQPDGITTKEVLASAFVDSLVLLGFSDAGKYEVSIQSLNRREKRSEAMQISVDPLDPPYMVASHTFASMPIFGGINVTYENPQSTELEVSILRKIEQDGMATWEVIDQFNKSGSAIDYDLYGLENEPMDFGFMIKDRYNNTSDTLFESHTPYLERAIDKGNFAPYPATYYDRPSPTFGTPLPGDIWEQHMTHATNGVHGLYDGVNTGVSANIYFSKSTSGIPQGVTVDMGRICKLSRIVLWTRPNAESYYGHSFPRLIEIYGSNSPSAAGIKTEDGITRPDDSWTLLGDYVCLPPSGALTISEVTDADKEYVKNNGHIYKIPNDAEGYRYIRLWTKEVWLAANRFVVISEMDVYGDYMD